MDDTNQSSGKGMGNQEASPKASEMKSKISKKKKWTTSAGSASEREDVLLKVGSLEYRAPGKRQRLVIGSIVVGLNVLLVLSVVIYFYSPAFQEFIYNFGR